MGALGPYFNHPPKKKRKDQLQNAAFQLSDIHTMRVLSSVTWPIPFCQNQNSTQQNVFAGLLSYNNKQHLGLVLQNRSKNSWQGRCYELRLHPHVQLSRSC